jgi:hypothetical protein
MDLTGTMEEISTVFRRNWAHIRIALVPSNLIFSLDRSCTGDPWAKGLPLVNTQSSTTHMTQSPSYPVLLSLPLFLTEVTSMLGLHTLAPKFLVIL